MELHLLENLRFFLKKELERLVVEIDNAIGQADAVIEQLNAVQLFSSDTLPISHRQALESQILLSLLILPSYFSSLLSLLGKINTPEAKAKIPKQKMSIFIEKLNFINDSLMAPAVISNVPMLTNAEPTSSFRESLIKFIKPFNQFITQATRDVKADGSSEKGEIGTVSIADEEKEAKAKAKRTRAFSG
ncbi:MAG: hypothetical protein HYT97_07705 [Elusimicrobia bacterium]|nr:hypothetical protein [Elusimicrobiota bacterium]